MRTKMWRIGLGASVILLAGLVMPAFSQIYADTPAGAVGVENDTRDLIVPADDSVEVYFPNGCIATDSPVAPWWDIQLTFTGMANIWLLGFSQDGSRQVIRYGDYWGGGAQIDLCGLGLSGGVYGLLIRAYSGPLILDAVRADNYTCQNAPPQADAGPNVRINSADQSLTTLQGTASDADDDPLTYRWFDGGTGLLDWAPVVGGAANLALASVATFSLGDHILTLKVTDGKVTTSDTMILTLLNTAPVVSVTPATQVVEFGVKATTISGSVADFDADVLHYRWVKDGVVLDSGTVAPPADGGPWDLLGLTIAPADSRFPVGENLVTLEVSDGTNPPVAKSAEVDVTDSFAPTVSPRPSVSMLWPPDHKLRPVAINANASDPFGDTVDLAVAVQCNETGGTAEPDWYVDSIDNVTGTILLRLRAERLGTGDGRVYAVTVTATDAGGNQSSAALNICVPYDKRK